MGFVVQRSKLREKVSNDIHVVTCPVECWTTHIQMSRSLWWLHWIWVFSPPTQAAEKGLVGHWGPLWSLADHLNCFIPVAEIVWPLHYRQNLANEMLSISVNDGESFRESIELEYRDISQTTAAEEVVYSKCTYVP